MSHTVSLSGIVAQIDTVIHHLDEITGQHSSEAMELKSTLEGIRNNLTGLCTDGDADHPSVRSFLIDFGQAQT